MLLYPSTSHLTQPRLVSLTDKGRRLGEVMDTDVEIQRRGLELGFRVVGDGGINSSASLGQYLRGKGVPCRS
ncbi:hypothetical protein Acor_02360 [Acrocarpospora corrugata]|uniref:Uncharacterized protein n=1 Tax=Acrocarpospora corrugata TaxID=35763 RepID=A0A5M3VN15_9ACTN|nr:hypothetical protein [Acrocarpospora corrugata]GER98174.1 hypothetical protein Acor_02360 [Acrocarpospora corrugata]